MSNIFTTVGLLLVAIIMMVLIVLLSTSLFRMARDGLRNKYRKEMALEIAGSIQSASFWFCEDMPTHKLLVNAAFHITEYRQIYANSLRELWRTDRKLPTLPWS